MKNKLGMSMAIRTIIYIVLGLVVLILLITLVERQTGFFSETIDNIMGRSNVDSVVKACNAFALSESVYEYCCVAKEVKLESKEEIVETCVKLREREGFAEMIEELGCEGVICVSVG